MSRHGMSRGMPRTAPMTPAAYSPVDEARIDPEIEKILAENRRRGLEGDFDLARPADMPVRVPLRPSERRGPKRGELGESSGSGLVIRAPEGGWRRRLPRNLPPVVRRVVRVLRDGQRPVSVISAELGISGDEARKAANELVRLGMAVRTKAGRAQVYHLEEQWR